ncbi:MAG: universal stress protein [Candidatus Tectomicrobia bacterium]|uniref:Universal stress protein n=1 Tax=Tectimicrobiota bacterium TaxID=2528274 RepID=A0A932MS05_UNCTE|nr:universal stress protein [Candidatus Tectomicrobia bacterium]
MNRARKILVPVEMSDRAVGLIRAASRLAKRWEAEMVVLNVGKAPHAVPDRAAGYEGYRNLPFIRGPYSLGRLLSVRSRGPIPGYPESPSAAPVPEDIRAPDALKYPAEPARAREDARLQIVARLEEIMRRGEAGPEAQAEVVWGDPAEEIVRAAEGGDYGLIIMATRGRRGLSRVLRGSVTEEVIRRAPCAVMAIREEILGVEGTARDEGRSAPR